MRKGYDPKGNTVAVKTYKKEAFKSRGDLQAAIVKFKRQIEVLNKLMAPITEAEGLDARLKHPLLLQIEPRKCFLELIDYSRDANGEPGRITYILSSTDVVLCLKLLRQDSV